MSIKPTFLISFVVAAALAACSSDESGAAGDAGSTANKVSGFHVTGRFLYDKCGNQVVLRGVNEMIIWGKRDGVPTYAEIAKTGANVVRIVWNKTGSATELETTITNALAQKLIPLVENHDATGDLSLVPAAVDYWVQPDVAKVLLKFQDKVLLNIANEAGNSSVVISDYEDTYKTAITRLRDAGFTMPLIIDGPGWGSDIVTLESAGPRLVTADPLHNLLLSVHAYWADADGSLTRMRMQECESQGLPLIVGEFADTKVGTCTAGSYNVQVLMEEAQNRKVGWLAWSWGAVKNSDCPGKIDMTSDGTFAGLQNWGLVVATTDTNSIKNTSVISPYIDKGSCD
jgi:mannan endo-1,4-beta-mannosidase